MSEISETEIKAMTKEQNYIRGYKDGKSDVLDKIRAEIPKLVCCENEYRQALVKVADVIKCIDKYKGEST